MLLNKEKQSCIEAYDKEAKAANQTYPFP
jgi:hypothetical protein